jgi:hypothetical protein
VQAALQEAVSALQAGLGERLRLVEGFGALGLDDRAVTTVARLARCFTTDDYAEVVQRGAQ